MTRSEFWLAFKARKYAVLCETRGQHDQFQESYADMLGRELDHIYHSNFPYITCDYPTYYLLGWTRNGISTCRIPIITFQEWLEMTDEQEDEIEIGNLSEVI